MCIWTRLLELEPEVAKRYILGSGHGAVCPLYFLGKMNPSTFAELPKEKSHRIPVCIYALNKDPIWFMNSPLQQDGCGRKFHIIAHYQVWSHENESIAKRYSKSIKLEAPRINFFQGGRVRQIPIYASGVSLRSVKPVRPSFPARRTQRSGLLTLTKLDNVNCMLYIT